MNSQQARLDSVWKQRQESRLRLATSGMLTEHAQIVLAECASIYSIWLSADRLMIISSRDPEEKGFVAGDGGEDETVVDDASSAVGLKTWCCCRRSLGTFTGNYLRPA